MPLGNIKHIFEAWFPGTVPEFDANAVNALFIMEPNAERLVIQLAAERN